MSLEQLKRVLSASMLKRLDNESGFIRHEWEELVEKLSCSDDPKLRAIGYEESEAIRSKKKVLKAP